MSYLCEKTLGQIISGTKCDRDKQIFLQKEGFNKIKFCIKKGPNGIGKCQKCGSSPPSTSMGVPTPPPPRAHKFLHSGYLNSVSCRFQHLFHPLPVWNTIQVAAIKKLMRWCLIWCIILSQNVSLYVWKSVYYNPNDSAEYSWIYYAN